MARQMDERDEEDISGAREKSDGDGGKQKADAIEMLKADHRRVEQLFDRYEQARRRAEKSKLAQQICLELTIHAELEEEIFYPACREHVDDPVLDEAQVEHDTAKILAAEIAMGTPTAPFFDAKVQVLAAYVRHHIQEEEKNADSIFAKALEGGVDTAELGRRMMARRQELMEDYSEELLLPQPRTLHVTLAQDEEVWAEPPGRGGARGAGRETQGHGRRQERGEGSWEGRGAWERRAGEEGRSWEGGRREGREERGYDERRAARGGEHEGRGWRGDPEGHAQAARRGWEHREGERGRESERSGRGEEGRGEEGKAEGGRTATPRGGEEHRGWRGDPKRHSEASRRGWEHRR